MYRTATRIFFLACLIFSPVSWANVNVRLGGTAQQTRVVFDSPTPVKLRAYLGDQDHTLLINIRKGHLNPPPAAGKIFNKITHERFSKNKSQIILTSASPLQILKHFTLPPSPENKKHRYVYDIGPKKGSVSPLNPQIGPVPSRSKPTKKVIIIDAGHGGQDPGTIGYRKTKEKDVTLRAARILAERLKQTKKYVVHLTRDKDIFLKLHERVRIGRVKKGDLFISLHADSSPKRDTRGLSIYTLSKIASDREAARLAAKENKADLFSGIDFASETPEVANILIDLTKRETMNLSVTLAHALKKSLNKRIQLLDNTHRFANFAVLRTPDVPAVLIELGYLSNPADEKLLKTYTHLSKIAEGISHAIDAYFAQHNTRA